MKLTKKVLSIILAVALVLGSVAVAANAAVTTLEGSVMTWSITSDKDVSDGKAEVKPGETINVTVSATSNFYPSVSACDMVLWTAGVFDDASSSYTVGVADDYWKCTYNFPLKTTSFYPSDYPMGDYTGFFCTRAYNVDLDGAKMKQLDNDTLYTFTFTVPEDAEIGSVVDVVIPASKVYSGSGATRGWIRQGVANALLHDSNAVVSNYCETTNVDALQITVVDESSGEPEVKDPVTTLEGSEITWSITSDKDVSDGVAEVKPGDTINVTVSATTNFYPSVSACDMVLWTAGVLDDASSSYTVGVADDYWKCTYNFPLKTTTFYPSDYPMGDYTGFFCTRAYNVDMDGAAMRMLNNDTLYTFTFKIPEDAQNGEVIDVVIPASKVYSGSGATRGWIRQGVANAPLHDSNAVVSSYCETTNVDSLKIKVVTEGGEEPPVVEYADLTALKAAIAKAATADTANCTFATVTEFNAALAAAEALNKETTLKDQQDAVNAAAQRLEDAITGLKKLAKVDYSALEAAKRAYEEISGNAGNYSNWDEYAALYVAAVEIDTTVEYDNEQGTIQAAVDAAATALANFTLVEFGKVDYTALNNAIAAYEAKLGEADKYSNWAAYEALYNAAKAIDQSVVYDKNGEQAKADKAAADLNGFELVEYAKVNYDALNDAIAAYEAKVADKDIYSNWAEYEALYEAAKAIDQNVVYNKNGEQAKADAAAAALADFALVEYAKVDYTALNDAIAAYEAKLDDANLYANWADYEALYNAALAIDQSVVYDKNGEQKAADDAAAALNNFQLEEKTLDYTAWNAAVAAIPADLAGYKPYSVESYEAAKATAEGAKAAAVEALDQEALDAAAQQLLAAIAMLEVKADNSALVAAVARAEGLVEANYTPDSWAAANIALFIEEAKAVLANGDATESDIATATEALEAAEAALVIKADKAALLEALKAAQALVENEAAYTPNSFAEANLAGAITTATAVYDDDNATAQAVADAIAALKAAEAKLVLKADKAALEAAINTEVVLENATAETLAAYNDALAAAKDVLADDNATEDAVLTATNNLLAAIDGIDYYGACDYTAYNEAVAAANALVEADYTTTSWAAADIAAVLAANAVEEGLMDKDDNQDKIDAAAQAINDAIALLEKKADVSALEEAVAAEPKVAEEYATEDSWKAYADAKAAAEALLANAADLGESKADEIAAAAQALVDANAALVEKDADYTAVEEALAYVATKGELNQYTQASVKKLQAAIDAVVYGLGISKQKDVDAAAAAIVAAADELVISQAAVSNVEMLGGDYVARETRQYEITVAGAPTKTRFINEKGGTVTFARNGRNVTIVSYNANGEVIDYAEEEPAYEVWTVATSLGEGTYQATAKIGADWEAFTYEFEIELVDYAENEVYFVAAPADGSAEAGKTLALTRNAPAVMTVTVPDTVNKVQLYFTLGEKTFTTTYAPDSAYATVTDNGDGTCTWILNRNFSTIGEYTMALKLRDSKGWYDAVTDVINVTVTK